MLLLNSSQERRKVVLQAEHEDRCCLSAPQQAEITVTTPGAACATRVLSQGLANSMGLFLQKTNIIRDYLEDYEVMAIATLVACFDNPLVFTGVVKIRKGLTARLIVACCDGPDAVPTEKRSHDWSGKQTQAQTVSRAMLAFKVSSVFYGKLQGQRRGQRYLRFQRAFLNIWKLLPAR
eukprot:Skav222414  [mRNA]  locus=scaffold2890:5994:12121:+ [translate_table: standard]